MNSFKFFNVLGLSVLVSSLTSLSAFGYTAVMYDLKSDRKEALFKMEVTEAKVPGSAQENLRAVFQDMQGNVVIEQNVLVEGSKLIRDEISQKQLGQTGLIEVKDGMVHFSKTVDGKTTVEKEKLESTLVTAANFQRYIRENWSEIASGKTVSFRYGVWDRQETVGFKFFKVKDDKIGETPVVVVKMKPTSFIIAALVDPLEMKFTADGSKLLEMKGRVAPKRKVGDSFKDLDADVVYSY